MRFRRRRHHAVVGGHGGAVRGAAGRAAGVQVGGVLRQVGVRLRLEGQGAVALDERVLQGLAGGPPRRGVQILRSHVPLLPRVSLFCGAEVVSPVYLDCFGGLSDS